LSPCSCNQLLRLDGVTAHIEEDVLIGKHGRLIVEDLGPYLTEFVLDGILLIGDPFPLGGNPR
jgi:hypothetical protein